MSVCLSVHVSGFTGTLSWEWLNLQSVEGGGVGNYGKDARFTAVWEQRHGMSPNVFCIHLILVILIHSTWEEFKIISILRLCCLHWDWDCVVSWTLIEPSFIRYTRACLRVSLNLISWPTQQAPQFFCMEDAVVCYDSDCGLRPDLSCLINSHGLKWTF